MQDAFKAAFTPTFLTELSAKSNINLTVNVWNVEGKGNTIVLGNNNTISNVNNFCEEYKKKKEALQKALGTTTKKDEQTRFVPEYVEKIAWKTNLRLYSPNQCNTFTPDPTFYSTGVFSFWYTHKIVIGAETTKLQNVSLSKTFSNMYGAVPKINPVDLAQPVGADSTAFLISEDGYFLTAAHCVEKVEKMKPKPLVLVTGFENFESSGTITVPSSNVLKNWEIIDMKHDGNTFLDYAIIKVLDWDKQKHLYLPGEPKKKRYVFPLANKEPAVNDEIGMFGHPFGMQLKYTYGVLSKNNPDAKFYEAQIDAFAGNSGSPVFTKYGAVFGILVGGFSMQSTGRFNLKATNPNDAQFVTESDYFGALETNANTVAECICKYTTFEDVVKQNVPNLATPVGAEEFSVGEENTPVTSVSTFQSKDEFFAVPSHMLNREKEIQEGTKYIDSCWSNQKCALLLVQGMSGIGTTAVLSSIAKGHSFKNVFKIDLNHKEFDVAAIQSMIKTQLKKQSYDECFDLNSGDTCLALLNCPSTVSSIFPNVKDIKSKSLIIMDTHLSFNFADHKVGKVLVQPYSDEAVLELFTKNLPAEKTQKAGELVALAKACKGYSSTVLDVLRMPEFSSPVVPLSELVPLATLSLKNAPKLKRFMELYGNMPELYEKLLAFALFEDTFDYEAASFVIGAKQFAETFIALENFFKVEITDVSKKGRYSMHKCVYDKVRAALDQLPVEKSKPYVTQFLYYYGEKGGALVEQAELFKFCMQEKSNLNTCQKLLQRKDIEDSVKVLNLVAQVKFLASTYRFTDVEVYSKILLDLLNKQNKMQGYEAGVAYALRAYALTSQYKPKLAEKYHDKAMVIFAKLTNKDSEYGKLLRFAAYNYFMLGEYDKAEATCKSAISKLIIAAKNDLDDFEVVHAQRMLAKIHYKQEKFTDAEIEYSKLLARAKEFAATKPHPLYVAIYKDLACHRYCEGKYEASIEFNNVAKGLVEASPVSAIEEIANLYYFIGKCHLAKHELDLAEASFKDALIRYQKLVPSKPMCEAQCLIGRATVFKFRNDETVSGAFLDQALNSLMESLTNPAEDKPVYSSELLHASTKLTLHLQYDKQAHRCEELLLKLYEIVTQNFGIDSKKSAEIMAALISNYHAMNNVDDAKKKFAEYQKQTAGSNILVIVKWYLRIAKALLHVHVKDAEATIALRKYSLWYAEEAKKYPINDAMHAKIDECIKYATTELNLYTSLQHYEYSKFRDAEQAWVKGYDTFVEMLTTHHHEIALYIRLLRKLYKYAVENRRYFDFTCFEVVHALGQSYLLENMTIAYKDMMESFLQQVFDGNIVNPVMKRIYAVHSKSNITLSVDSKWANYLQLLDMPFAFIINKESKLAMDVKGESKKNGASIILWTKKTSKYNNQLWKFENGLVKNMDSSKILASISGTYVLQEDEQEIKASWKKNADHAVDMSFYNVTKNSEHFYIAYKTATVRRHVCAQKNISKSDIVIKDLDFNDETHKWILEKPTTNP